MNFYRKKHYNFYNRIIICKTIKIKKYKKYHHEFNWQLFLFNGLWKILTPKKLTNFLIESYFF